jgi:hypothetical protein
MRAVDVRQVYLTHRGKLLIVSITQHEEKGSTAEANAVIDSLRFL